MNSCSLTQHTGAKYSDCTAPVYITHDQSSNPQSRIKQNHHSNSFACEAHTPWAAANNPSPTGSTGGDCRAPSSSPCSTPSLLRLLKKPRRPAGVSLFLLPLLSSSSAAGSNPKKRNFRREEGLGISVGGNGSHMMGLPASWGCACSAVGLFFLLLLLHSNGNKLFRRGRLCCTERRCVGSGVRGCSFFAHFFIFFVTHAGSLQSFCQT